MFFADPEREAAVGSHTPTHSRRPYLDTTRAPTNARTRRRAGRTSGPRRPGARPCREHASEALPLSRSDDLHLVVHLAGRRAQDERADGAARQRDVGVGAEDVHLGVGDHQACPRGVLDGEARLAALVSQTRARRRAARVSRPAEPRGPGARRARRRTWPAMRPTARDRWSPLSIFTSVTSNDSVARYKQDGGTGEARHSSSGGRRHTTR